MSSFILKRFELDPVLNRHRCCPLVADCRKPISSSSGLPCKHRVATSGAIKHTDRRVQQIDSALLKLFVRRKIMCIPIIYISCVKILRMYSVKNSLMLMVICCFHILVASAGQQHCFLTARGTEKKGRWSGLPGATGVSRRSGSRGPRRKHLLETSHDCKATVDGRRSLELKPHMGTFVHISHVFFFSSFNVCVYD